MAVTYRRAQPGSPALNRLTTRRRAKPLKAAVRTNRRPAAHAPRPAHPDPRQARCDVLSRRIVMLGALSMLMFIAGFFMTIPHAILCLSLPLALAFSAKHRLDTLQDELQFEAEEAKEQRRSSGT